MKTSQIGVGAVLPSGWVKYQACLLQGSQPGPSGRPTSGSPGRTHNHAHLHVPSTGDSPDLQSRGLVSDRRGFPGWEGWGRDGGAEIASCREILGAGRGRGQAFSVWPSDFLFLSLSAVCFPQAGPLHTPLCLNRHRPAAPRHAPHAPPAPSSDLSFSIRASQALLTRWAPPEHVLHLQTPVTLQRSTCYPAFHWLGTHTRAGLHGLGYCSVLSDPPTRRALHLHPLSEGRREIKPPLGFQ